MSFGRKQTILSKFVPDTQLIVVGSVVAAVMAFIYIWQWVSYLEEGFAVQELMTQQQQLEEQKELLMIERAFLSRFERLEKVAQEQFGLEYSKPNQYRYISP